MTGRAWDRRGVVWRGWSWQGQARRGMARRGRAWDTRTARTKRSGPFCVPIDQKVGAIRPNPAVPALPPTTPTAVGYRPAVNAR